MLIYSQYWDLIWLPNDLADRFLLVPDKLAIRCQIAIELIPQRGRVANEDLSCQYRVVRCDDGNSQGDLYPTNALWQIHRLRADDLIIALDPSGNPIEIHRSELDCFVSLDIVLHKSNLSID
ncbi:hypothetical protein [Chamaesiphon sp. OTE_20_metabat_361]|uniref:hypothetical protein n=1 Tax=Chamaesiphon sp. OTE_20_metabat_361 TaxID=2964689 RepID=UPI00286A7D66|nr:hypothetical protein [Chamaesiphon sp. OTE_20_metabat_361]